MESVKNGGDRQEIHERVRVHSQAAAARMKMEGLKSDLLDRIADDPAFPLSREALTALLAPEKYTGRAEEQTEKFISEVVDPLKSGANRSSNAFLRQTPVKSNFGMYFSSEDDSSCTNPSSSPSSSR